MPVTGTLTQHGVLDGALGIVQVHEELLVQVLDVALVVSLPVPTPDAPQPAGQGGGRRQPHLMGHVVQTLEELCGRAARGVG